MYVHTLLIQIISIWKSGAYWRFARFKCSLCLCVGFLCSAHFTLFINSAIIMIVYWYDHESDNVLSSLSPSLSLSRTKTLNLCLMNIYKQQIFGGVLYHSAYLINIYMRILCICDQCSNVSKAFSMQNEKSKSNRRRKKYYPTDCNMRFLGLLSLLLLW